MLKNTESMNKQEKALLTDLSPKDIAMKAPPSILLDRWPACSVSLSLQRCFGTKL